jgi:hypothetical protein
VTMGQTCMSVTRAAGGISELLLRLIPAQTPMGDVQAALHE